MKQYFNDKRDLIVKPTTISIITTYKCTAACANCCFGCNPKRKEYLPINDQIAYITEATKAYTSISTLVLTGGECFTFGDELLDVVRFASTIGLSVRIVTNASFGNTFKKAYLHLEKYKKAGLTEINISTGYEHQKWVSSDNVVNVITASLKLGLTTAINSETHLNKERASSFSVSSDIRLTKFINKFSIINGAWLDKNQDLVDGNAQLLHTRCQYVLTGISINPNGEMLPCCGLTADDIPLFKIGNCKERSIKEIYEKQFFNIIFLWLSTEGPFSMQKSYTNNFSPNEKWEHDCKICYNLFTKDEIITYFESIPKNKHLDIVIKHLINKGC